MIKYIKNIIGFLFLALVPVVNVLAETGSTGDTGDVGSTGNTGGPSEIGMILQNPLGDQTLMGFLQDLLDVIMFFAVPLIVFMIIYAGFKYVMARGNPGEVESAHKAILYAIIGGVLILGAWIILEVIQGTVDAFRT